MTNITDRLRGPAPSFAAMRDAADEIERLRQRLDAQQWQPISTAPKNRRILLLRNTDHISTGQYEPDKYARWPRPYWTDEYLHGVRWAREYAPTHWMELPDLPEVA